MVAYINHQGGTTSSELCDLALILWKFCIKRRIMIKAFHLGGDLNSRADFLSRRIPSDHSYFLRHEIFNRLKRLLSFNLVIDCFASRLNTKLPNFISRYSDPYSSFIDAFSLPWKDKIYLFPPVPVLNQVLSKFISDKVGHGLLVCPFWPSQSWFSIMLDLLIAPPFLLPLGAVVDVDHRLPRRSRLLACPIGCAQQEQRAYQKGLPNVRFGGSNQKPFKGIRLIGNGFMIGSIKKRAITVELL